MSNKFPKENIMKYDNWRGVSNQLINIPVCDNKDLIG